MKFDRGDSVETSCWEKYQERVTAYNNYLIQEHPGQFAVDRDERFYQQCLECHLPPSSEIPILRLDLKVHLLRNKYIGCSNMLNEESIKTIVQQTNEYWLPARIQFRLIDVVERNWTTIEQQNNYAVSEEEQIQVKDFIYESLTRGPDGKMMKKGQRKHVFLNKILSSFEYYRIKSSMIDSINVFDVWFFDCTGQKSQGICINRSKRTVILGERSSKGYPVLTCRPLHCIAKTMAHELGHALDLNHPAGKRFTDGKGKCSANRSHKNLMQGGKDRKGGGGSYLEPWQICLTRWSATKFLEHR